MIERTDGVVRLRVDPWKIWLAWGWGVPVGAVCLVGGLVIAVATGTRWLASPPLSVASWSGHLGFSSLVINSA